METRPDPTQIPCPDAPDRDGSTHRLVGRLSLPTKVGVVVAPEAEPEYATVCIYCGRTRDELIIRSWAAKPSSVRAAERAEG